MKETIRDLLASISGIDLKYILSIFLLPLLIAMVPLLGNAIVDIPKPMIKHKEPFKYFSRVFFMLAVGVTLSSFAFALVLGTWFLDRFPIGYTNFISISIAGSVLYVVFEKPIMKSLITITSKVEESVRKGPFHTKKRNVRDSKAKACSLYRLGFMWFVSWILNSFIIVLYAYSITNSNSNNPSFVNSLAQSTLVMSLVASSLTVILFNNATIKKTKIEIKTEKVLYSVFNGYSAREIEQSSSPDHLKLYNYKISKNNHCITLTKSSSNSAGLSEENYHIERANVQHIYNDITYFDVRFQQPS